MPLSEEQLAQIEEQFNSHDLNADGNISLQEMMDVQRVMGMNPTKTEVEYLMKMADINGDNGLSFDEFKSITEQMFDSTEGDNNRAALEAAFRLFDANGSGKLSAQEFFEVMQELGEPLSEEEAMEAMKEADSDGDGFLTIEESFREIFAKLQSS